MPWRDSRPYYFDPEEQSLGNVQLVVQGSLRVGMGKVLELRECWPLDAETRVLKPIPTRPHQLQQGHIPNSATPWGKHLQTTPHIRVHTVKHIHWPTHVQICMLT